MTGILRFLILCALLSSCIKEEALNTEADILECIVDKSILKRDPVVENDRVVLMVKGNTDLTRQAPEFVISEGANIHPANGTMLDFTRPQSYVVTSEDKQWQKLYSVSFIVDEYTTLFHFEDTIREAANRYYIFAEKVNGEVTMEWGSGNAGFAMTGAGKSPADYPTIQSDDGYNGKCAGLITRNTGSLGAIVNMPIAAGNLFIGTFDLKNALGSPLKATRFGLPFYNIPTTFSGYYKYKSGEVYYENGNPVEGVKDKCHFYAVLYETDETLSTLDGTNVLTHPNIISAAVVEDQTETNVWSYFNQPFVYRPGKSIEADKLKDGKYNLAVVFTSSVDGGTFKGAPGSALYIDEVEIALDTE